MENKKTDTRPEGGSTIATILYTMEAVASRERAEDDLKAEDPSIERASAVLAGKEEPPR